MVLLAGIGSWYGKTLKLNKGPAHPSEREAIHELTHGKVRKSVAILMALTFSKDFYLVSITSFYTFYLIHTFGLTIQSAQLYLFLFLFAVAAGTVIGGPIGDRIGTRRVIWWSILGVLPFTLALPYVGLLGTAILSVIIGLILASAHPGHHRLCAGADPGTRRHGGGSVLWPRLRRCRHRRRLSRLAGRPDQHHLRLPCVRLSAGDRTAGSISARDGKAERRGKTKAVRAERSPATIRQDQGFGPLDYDFFVQKKPWPRLRHGQGQSPTRARKIGPARPLNSAFLRGIGKIETGPFAYG